MRLRGIGGVTVGNGLVQTEACPRDRILLHTVQHRVWRRSVASLPWPRPFGRRIHRRYARWLWWRGTEWVLPATYTCHPGRGRSRSILGADDLTTRCWVLGFGREGARRGYAVVMQDTRGRFASKGENLPFHSDVTDGADTLLWIGRQDWSNGRVGTWGGSAGAITQFQLMAAGQGGVGIATSGGGCSEPIRSRLHGRCVSEITD